MKSEEVDKMNSYTYMYCKALLHITGSLSLTMQCAEMFCAVSNMIEIDGDAENVIPQCCSIQAQNNISN